MSDKDDGGTAFPVGSLACGSIGMSLRDYFAGQALAGLAAWGKLDNYLLNNADRKNYLLVRNNIKTKVHETVIRSLWAPIWSWINPLTYGDKID